MVIKFFDHEEFFDDRRVRNTFDLLTRGAPDLKIAVGIHKDFIAVVIGQATCLGMIAIVGDLKLECGGFEESGGGNLVLVNGMPEITGESLSIGPVPEKVLSQVRKDLHRRYKAFKS